MLYPPSMRREGLRVGISTLVALSGAIGAHHFGGGGFISASALVVEISLLFVALLALRKYKYDGPALAALITISQLCSHFILGTSNGLEAANPSRMLISHAAFGFFTYILISTLEDFWIGCARLVREMLVPKSFFRFVFASLPKIHISDTWLRSFSLYFRQAHGLRAPPALSLSI